FSVSATATGIAYRWRKNNVEMDNVDNASGVKSSSLSLSSISYDAPSDDAVYTCIISSTCGNESTTPADLTVYDQTSVTTDPVDFMAVDGGNASFSITAEGEALGFQWYKVPAIMLSNDAVYSDVTTSILTLTALDLTHDGSYYCEVTGTCGDVTSGSGKLTVNPTTLITTHPTGPLDKCIGEDANFDVVASGTNLTYQWYKDGELLNNTANISGVTDPGLEIVSVQITDEGSYSCLVSGDEGLENSFPAQLNVDEPTNVTTQPIDDETCEGDDVLFVIEAIGSDLTYQWEKDGDNLSDVGNISGSNETVLTITNLGVADAGDYLCRVVTSGTCGDDVSNAATLIVNQNTQI
ncbi:MAG: immunoglobulin domain-containing protein, partial [Candidatus Delongbacteria bacterium]|nr:immunoglobulin domain-containing protein [Candidatus Delongbacteria bacterium]